MESSNTISQSILQPSSSSSSTIYSSSSSSSSGFFDGLKNINVTTWILIILILAFLGLNIFVYLAKGTQTIADIFGPITQKLFGETGSVVGQTVDVSAEGAKAVVGGTADVIQGGLTTVQNVTPNGLPNGAVGLPNGAVAKSSIQNHPVSQIPPQGDQSTLNKAINTAQSQDTDYQAHEASSSVHSSGKAGWCYVGNDRGFRSCAEVGVNDICMSGDIFPSREICMNPTLRN